MPLPITDLEKTVYVALEDGDIDKLWKIQISTLTRGIRSVDGRY